MNDCDIEVASGVVGDPLGLRAPDEGVVLADLNPGKRRPGPLGLGIAECAAKDPRLLPVIHVAPAAATFVPWTNLYFATAASMPFITSA